MSIIKKPFVRSTGAAVPDVPVGRPFAMLDRDNKIYAAGYQGATQKHPASNPMMSGYRIDLSNNGPFSEDATDGYVQTTGTTAQTSDGLVSTLNAGNLLTEVDLPGIGTITAPSMIHVELGIDCPTPGAGNGAGFRVAHQVAAFVFDIQCQADATEWHVADNSNGAGWVLGTVGVFPYGSISTLNYVEIGWVNNWSITLGQNYSSSMGRIATLNKTDTKGGGFSSSGYPNATPPPFDLVLRAQWVSGTDLVVTWKSVTILPKFPLTVVS